MDSQGVAKMYPMLFAVFGGIDILFFDLVIRFVRGQGEFHAVIGGIGALGVVIELELQLIPSFLVKRTTTYVDKQKVEKGILTLYGSHYNSHK